METVIFAGLFWIACGFAASGFFNAHAQGSFPTQDSAGDRREFLAFSVGWGFLFGPFALLLSPFLTGFWADGWTLSLNLGEPSNND